MMYIVDGFVYRGNDAPSFEEAIRNLPDNISPEMFRCIDDVAEPVNPWSLAMGNLYSY